MQSRYFSSSIFTLDLRETRKKALDGCVESMYLLGLVYCDVTFSRSNISEAKNWFHKAAQYNHGGAMLQLAYIYLDDSNQTLVERGIEWLHRAALKNITEARNLLRYFKSLQGK